MSPDQILSNLDLFQKIAPIASAIGFFAIIVGLISFAIAGLSSTTNLPAIIITIVCAILIAGSSFIIDNSKLTSAQRNTLQSAPSKIVSTKTIQLTQAPNKKQPMFYDDSNNDVSYWTSSGDQSHLNTVPKKAKVKFVSPSKTNQSANTLVIETSQYLDPRVDKILAYEESTHDTYVFVDSSK